jgi:hypothetical protein
MGPYEDFKHLGIYRWYFEIPLEDVITPPVDGSHTGLGDHCLLCGRKLSEKKAPHYVHLTTDGNLVSSPEPIDTSQGFFPVGPECVRRIPNNFSFPTPF